MYLSVIHVVRHFIPACLVRGYKLRITSQTSFSPKYTKIGENHDYIKIILISKELDLVRKYHILEGLHMGPLIQCYATA